MSGHTIRGAVRYNRGRGADLGTFAVQIDVGDPDGTRYEPVEALVDSGATFTFIPRSVLERMGVRPLRKMAFEIADGSRMERDFGQTWVRLNGERSISPVIFGDDAATPLLGAVTLEIFGLGIDPVDSRLIPVPSLM